MRAGLVSWAWVVAAVLVAGGAAAQQATTTAAAVPPESVAWASVKLAHLVFGLLGAACALALVQITWATVFTTITLGLGCALAGTPAVVHYLFTPPVFQGYENAVAFALGAFGFLIVPIGKKVLEQIRENPLGFYQQWRRGGTVPPDAPPQQQNGGR
jgi:hypothetical protein